MKTTLSALFLLLAGHVLQAQSSALLRTNLTDPLVGRYSLGFEQKVGSSFSVGMDVDYLSREVSLESDHPWYEFLTTQKQGWIFEPQVRWYPGGEALKGSYAALGGFFGIAQYRPAEGVLDNDDWSSVGASLQVGRQVSLGRFVLDGFIGGTWAEDDYPDWASSSVATKNTSPSRSTSSPAVSLRRRRVSTSPLTITFPL